MVLHLGQAMYKEQLAMGWPGLSAEVGELCNTVGLENIKKVTKKEIQGAIFFHNYKDFNIKMQGYKKINDIRDDELTKFPEYFVLERSVYRVRMVNKIRSKIINYIKMSLKTSYKASLV